MNVYSKDSSANALIICDFGKSYFTYNPSTGFKLVFERHVRKKIFNKNAYNEATFSIPLYHENQLDEKISKLKAYTYNLENGKIDQTRMRKRDVIYEEKNDNLSYAKFTLPNVKEGSIIEVKYTVISDFFYTLNDWQFQHDIPVLWSEYNVQTPEYFQYYQHAYGFEPYAINDRNTKNNTFNFQQRQRTGNQYVAKSEVKNVEINYEETIYRWVAKNLPAFKPENYTTSPKNYMNRIEFELAKVQMPGSQANFYSRTWNDLRKELYDDYNFGGQLKRPNTFLNDQAETMLDDFDDPTARMHAAFNFIRRNMKWNNEYSTFSSENLRKAWNEKSGNSADINLLMVVLLNKLGIESNPVILSTRAHGQIPPTHPSVSKTNYVITAAQIDGQTYLMDATEPLSKINMLPFRCLNGKGRLITENSTKPVNLKANAGYDENAFTKITIEEDGLHLDITSRLNDYAAYNFRNRYYSQENKNDYVKEIEENNHIEVDDISFTGLDSLHKSISLKIKASSNSNFTNAGSRIYLNPIVYNRLEENPFKLDQRKYPVDYGYTHQYLLRYHIDIPKGYQLETLPKQAMVKMQGNKALYTYSVREVPDGIEITNLISINKDIFLEDEYSELKAFYNNIIDKQSEQIVLKQTPGN